MQNCKKELHEYVKALEKARKENFDLEIVAEESQAQNEKLSKACRQLEEDNQVLAKQLSEAMVQHLEAEKSLQYEKEQNIGKSGTRIIILQFFCIKFSSQT